MPAAGDAGPVRPLVLGHRGASADAPENTLAAFRLAVEQGADGVELDVWRCGSGEVVVHHDADLRRSTGGASSAEVARASLAELRAADVGAPRGQRFRGERVPLLAEVLEALPAAMVNVELKAARAPDLRLAAAAARVLRAAPAPRRCVVSSFSPLLLAAFRLAAPELETALLLAPGRGWALRAGAGAGLSRPHGLHPERGLVTAARMRRWRADGRAIRAWTVDDAHEVRRLAALGVDAIITNRPRRALEALAGAGGDPRRGGS